MKKRKMVEKWCQNKIVVELYIPHTEDFVCPHTNCNIDILTYWICLDTSANTSKFIFFTFFSVIAILGFLMRILYFKFITCLCKALFFFFNFLFLLNHILRCKRRLSLLAIWILFCALKVWFSFLIYLFNVSSSKISCFNILTTRGSCGSLS